MNPQKGEVLFQQEPFDNVIDEMMPLLQAHYHEISKYQDIPLVIDQERYRRTEANGGLKLFTARNEQNKIVGYISYFVHTNSHYSTSLQAVQDVLYVDPEYRGRGFGFQFIGYCDEALKSMGVQVVYQHVKVYHNFGPLLEKLGYEHLEHLYGKRLDKWDPTTPSTPSQT